MKKNTIIQSTGFKVTAMVVFIAVTAFALHQYAQLIGHLISINYNWQFELYMVMGMLFFQYPFIFKKTATLKVDYYYNMLLVSFMGALQLVPLLIINRYSIFNDTFNLVYFFAVVLFMFFNHKKRVAKLKLPAIMSYSWVLYRFIILLFIIKIHA